MKHQWCEVVYTGTFSAFITMIYFLNATVRYIHGNLHMCIIYTMLSLLWLSNAAEKLTMQLGLIIYQCKALFQLLVMTKSVICPNIMPKSMAGASLRLHYEINILTYNPFSFNIQKVWLGKPLVSLLPCLQRIPGFSYSDCQNS